MRLLLAFGMRSLLRQRTANAAGILSEDLNSGQIIAGVRIEDPFLKEQTT